MERAGLELAVEGLFAFLGDLRSAREGVDKFTDTTNIFEKAFGFATDSLVGFGRELLNVAEITLGIMLRDAIEGVLGLLRDLGEYVLDLLGEMASQAIEAGNEFQLLSMRLRGFNLQDATNSGLEYNAAMEQSISITKEQLEWIMKIAAVTPFDATDIANIYTQSRAYGFGNEEAIKLTESILDFTAAMGLSGVEAERIIVNLGQMAQRGKITAREINDLARGSFVPIGDVLDRISTKMGITTAELTKLISKPGGGVDYQLFIDAFQEMVAEEERFIDGAKRMSLTFQGASQNIIQTIRDLIGMYVVMPVLDLLGGKLSEILSFFTDSEGNWDRLAGALSRVGAALSTVIGDIWNLFVPNSTDLGETLLAGVEGFAAWLETHKGDIVNWFENARTTIGTFAENVKKFYDEKVVPSFNSLKEWIDEHGPGIMLWIDETKGKIEKFANDVKTFYEEKIVPAFDIIRTWVDEHGPQIQEFFDAVSDVISTVIKNIVGVDLDVEKGLPGFLDSLSKAMQWFVDNKDWIGTIATNITRFWLAWEFGKLIMGLVVDFFTNLPAQIIINLGLLASVIQDFMDDPERWGSIGKTIIQYIADAIVNNTYLLINSVHNAITSAVEKALNSLPGINIDIPPLNLTPSRPSSQAPAVTSVSSTQTNNTTTNYNITVTGGKSKFADSLAATRAAAMFGHLIP